MSIIKLIDFLKKNREHIVVPYSLDTALEVLQKARDGEKKSTRLWEPNGNYTGKQAEDIKALIEQGYSHREAERDVDAHADKTMDYEKALRSRVDPSVPSEKRRSEMQELAKHWLNNADKYERAHADQATQPMKYAAGKMEQAHDAATGDYKNDYNDFLSSDEIKGKSGRERHNAVRDWKKQWKTENPQYGEGLENLSETQKEYEKAHQASKFSLQDQINHVTSGSMPAELSSAEQQQFQKEIPKTTQAAAQFAGGASGGDAPPTGQIIVPEELNFAEKNRKLMGMLNDEQKDRHSRNSSAISAQEQVAQPKPEFQAKTVRRTRKPEGQ